MQAVSELDRSAAHWIERNIRAARPEQPGSEELARRYNRIAHETGFPVGTVCEWIHNWRGDLSEDALRDHIRQVRELEEQVGRDVRICDRCGCFLDSLHGLFFCQNCGEFRDA